MIDMPTNLTAVKSARQVPPKMLAKQLSFYYGTSKALKDVTLPLHQHQVTASPHC